MAYMWKYNKPHFAY